jgi:hypothetical protein
VPHGAVVDAVHTDLVDPSNGHCLTDLFINNMRIHGAEATYGECAAVVARAIEACSSLEVVCLYECYITPAVVEALR